MTYNHPDMDKFLHREVAERLGVGIMSKTPEERAEMARRSLEDMPLFNLIERGGDKETCVDLMVSTMDSTVRHLLDRVVMMDSVVHSRAASSMAAAALLKDMAGFLTEIGEGMLGSVASHVTEFRANASPELQRKMDEEMQRELTGRLGPDVGELIGKLLDGLDRHEQRRR